MNGMKLYVCEKLKPGIGLLLVLFLTLLTACVGTIENTNEVNKSAVVEAPPLVFEGVIDAKAISHSSVELWFRPALGMSVGSNIIYKVYVDGAFYHSFSIKGKEKNLQGYYTIGVEGLETGKTYAFSMTALNEDTDLESKNDRVLRVSTLSHKVPIFDGIVTLWNAAGAQSATTNVMSWNIARSVSENPLADDDDIGGYNIYRSEEADTVFNNKLVSVSGEDTLQYRDYQGSAERTYYYGVRAYNAIGREDKNWVVMKVTTRAVEDVVIDFKGLSAVETVHDNFGFYRLKVSWDMGSGNYDFVRVVYRKLATTSSSILNDEMHFCSGIDKDACNKKDPLNAEELYLDFYDLTINSAYINGLRPFEAYAVLAVACKDPTCKDATYPADAVGAKAFSGITAPEVAHFNGVQVVGINPDSPNLDSVLVDFSPGVDLTSGAYRDVTDAREVDVELYYVPVSKPAFSCAAWSLLPKCTASSTEKCYSYVATEEALTERTVMNLTPGTHCFAAKAYYESPHDDHRTLADCDDSSMDALLEKLTANSERRGKRYREMNNRIVCYDLNWTPPLFEGTTQCSEIHEDSLKLRWATPTALTGSPTYTGYRVFFRLHDLNTPFAIGSLKDGSPDPLFNRFTCEGEHDGSTAIRATKFDNTGMGITPVQAGVYYYIDVDKSKTDVEIKGLNPSTTYEILVKTVFNHNSIGSDTDASIATLDCADKYFFDLQKMRAVCTTAYPASIFTGWQDVYAVGPRSDGLKEGAVDELVPETLVRKYYPPSLDDVGNQDYFDGNGLMNDFYSQIPDMWISYLPTWYRELDVAPGADEAYVRMNQAVPTDPTLSEGKTVPEYARGKGTTNGIVRIAWKDFKVGIIDPNTSDYMTLQQLLKNAIDNNILSAEDARLKIGYRVYRAKYAGRDPKKVPKFNNPELWDELSYETDSGVALTGQGSLVHPFKVKTYINGNESDTKCNGGPCYKEEVIGEFVDYFYEGLPDKARVLYYKVEAVYNGRVLNPAATSDANGIINDDRVITVILPPKNMAFVNRWIANKEMCDILKSSSGYDDYYYKLGQGASTEDEIATARKVAHILERKRNYACYYNGLGSTEIDNEYFYDLGGHLLVDRFEAGLKMSRTTRTIDPTVQTFGKVITSGGCVSDPTKAPNRRFLGHVPPSQCEGSTWCPKAPADDTEAQLLEKPCRCSTASFKEQPGNIKLGDCLGTYYPNYTHYYEPEVATSGGEVPFIETYLSSLGVTKTDKTGSEYPGLFFPSPSGTATYMTVENTRYGGCQHNNITEEMTCKVNEGKIWAMKGTTFYILGYNDLYIQTADFPTKGTGSAADEDLDWDSFLSDEPPLVSEVWTPNWKNVNSFTLDQLDEWGKLFTSNASNLPPYVDVQPERAARICKSQYIQIDGVVDESNGDPAHESGLISVVDAQNVVRKRLLRRKEQIAAFAWSPYLTRDQIETISVGEPLAGDAHLRHGCFHNRTTFNEGSINNFNQGRAYWSSPVYYSANIWSDVAETADFADVFYGGGYARVTGAFRFNGSSSEMCVSRYGLQDHVGNVWEISSDQFHCAIDETDSTAAIPENGLGMLCSSIYMNKLDKISAAIVPDKFTVDTAVDAGVQETLKNSQERYYGFGFKEIEGGAYDFLSDSFLGSIFTSTARYRGAFYSQCGAIQSANTYSYTYNAGDWRFTDRCTDPLYTYGGYTWGYYCRNGINTNLDAAGIGTKSIYASLYAQYLVDPGIFNARDPSDSSVITNTYGLGDQNFNSAGSSNEDKSYQSPTDCWVRRNIFYKKDPDGILMSMDTSAVIDYSAPPTNIAYFMANYMDPYQDFYKFNTNDAYHSETKTAEIIFDINRPMNPDPAATIDSFDDHMHPFFSFALGLPLQCKKSWESATAAGALTLGADNWLESTACATDDTLHPVDTGYQPTIGPDGSLASAYFTSPFESIASDLYHSYVDLDLVKLLRSVNNSTRCDNCVANEMEAGGANLLSDPFIPARWGDDMNVSGPNMYLAAGGSERQHLKDPTDTPMAYKDKPYRHLLSRWSFMPIPTTDFGDRKHIGFRCGQLIPTSLITN